MDVFLYSSFIGISLLVILMPGPNVMVIVSTAISHGKLRGLQTVAGTSVAMTIQLLIAALASVSFVEHFKSGLSILKWVGLCYLIGLALWHFYRAWRGVTIKVEDQAAWSFAKGFLVSISNPKTILFFTAFLPQFVSTEYAYLPQIAILSLTFLVIAVICDGVYALLAHGLAERLAHLLSERRYSRWKNAISGGLYSLAGLGLYLNSKS